MATTAAGSGCEANVEFALQLLQPHVFPELLHTAFYLGRLKAVPPARRQGELPASYATDVGSAAVAHGLARLLPSLAQRCPGLLDPGAALEAATRYLSLAGLQGAWEAVGQRLLSSLQSLPPFLLDEDLLRTGLESDLVLQLHCDSEAWTVWCRMLAAAACFTTPDATAKMAWVLDRGRAHSRLAVEHAEVWGAAAASGDLARLLWLRERGFPWGGAEVLAAVLRQADVGVVVQVEREGGYLPPAGDECWGSAGLAPAAAGSPCNSAAKLSWLAGRGLGVGTEETVKAAAQHSNLAALHLALQHWGQRQQQEEGRSAVPPAKAMLCAVWSGHVPTAAWLHGAGCELHPELLQAVFCPGQLPMLRWLMEAGCPAGSTTLANVAGQWPSDTPADGEVLVEVLQLLSAAGLPAWGGEGWHPLFAAGYRGHPWPVWQLLQGAG